MTTKIGKVTVTNTQTGGRRIFKVGTRQYAGRPTVAIQYGDGDTKKFLDFAWLNDGAVAVWNRRGGGLNQEHEFYGKMIADPGRYPTLRFDWE